MSLALKSLWKCQNKPTIKWALFSLEKMKLKLPLEEVKFFYDIGCTAAQVGKLFNCSEKPIYRVLHKNFYIRTISEARKLQNKKHKIAPTYFLEGLNGLSKSFILDKLSSNIQKEKFEQRPELNFISEERFQKIYESSLQLVKKYALSRKDAIINRGYLTEIVYSEVLGRVYSPTQMDKIAKVWSFFNGKIIYLKRNFPIEILLERRPQFSKKFFFELEKVYDEYLSKSPLEVFVIKASDNLKNNLKEVEKIIK